MSSKMKMTLAVAPRLHPRMAQAARLLSLSSLDLAREVQERLDANPLLKYTRRPPFVPERVEAHAESLFASLLRQLHLATSPGGTSRRVGESFLEDVDEKGYVTVSCEEVARRTQVSVARAKTVLRLMQGFEPAGVMARSLQECFQLQLEEMGVMEPALKVVLEKLDTLKKISLVEFAQKNGLSLADVRRCFGFLRRCDPSPGFLETLVEPVPDLVVKKGEVFLNESIFPFVSLVPPPPTGKDEGARRFLARCRHEAHFLQWALKQRANTLLCVGREIVSHQKNFLRDGTLCPLTLRQVALRVGRHESTVSRAVSNKSIETPRGVFGLRFFFCSGIGATSAQAVSQRLAELVATETHPLSDEILAQRLRAEGIKIARRTITKYRQRLGLPSAQQRAP